MNNLYSRSVPYAQLAAIHTPRLDAIIVGFGRQTIKTLLRDLDPELSGSEAQRYEDELVRVAELWHRLMFLDAAARAACALVRLEPAVLDEHLEKDGLSVGAAQRAYIIARSILNDPDIMLDDAAPFDPGKELTLKHIARALVGVFVVRVRWDFEHISVTTARQLQRASELTYDSWKGRIARLARDYEKKTYPEKSTSGTSST